MVEFYEPDDGPVQAETGVEVVDPPGAADRSRPWAGHLLGALLGFAYLAMLLLMAHVGGRLQARTMRSFELWPLRVHLAVLALVGIVTVIVTLAGKRMPWLPTVPAIVLLVALVTSPLTPLGRFGAALNDQPWPLHLLDDLYGPTLGLDLLTVLAGATLTASAWAWWGHTRRRRETADAMRRV